MIQLFAFVFLAVAFAQQDVMTVFASAACTGAPVFQYSQPTTGAACTTACSVLGAAGKPCACTGGVSVRCNVASPTLLTGPSVAIFGASSCSGSSLASFSMTGVQICVPAVIVQTTMPTLASFWPKVTACGSVQFGCTGGQISVNTYGQSSIGCLSGTDLTCSTTSTSVNSLGTTGCASLSAGSALVAGCGVAGTCFHEDTIISYKGENLSLPELEKHSECAIPHIVSAIGSIVTVHCGAETKVLKLTSGHLVYTQRGLQPAGDLTKDDVLFADMDEQHKCQIVSVEKEKTMQKYFGLNCYESQVLASGLKSSTFEKLHSVPSFWMAIMGRILGIKRASEYGGYIEQLASKMSLV